MEELEDYSEVTRFLFTLVSVVFLVFTAVALVALNRTKRTPKTARFLSSALLFMDFLAVSTYTVRRYVTDPTANIAVQIIGIGWTLLALIVIGIMAIERLIVFNFANFYLKHVTLQKLKRIVIVICVVESCVYFFIRYGVCYIMYPDATAYDVVGKCNKVSYVYLYFWLLFVITVSSSCYVKIFGTIRYQCKIDKCQGSLRKKIFHSLKQYKSTSIVVLYLLTLIATTTVYLVVMTIPITQTAKRINVDIINVFNCVMDPCMYVIWFKECRLEMLKMVSCIVPRSLNKIHTMRLTVFDIVTSDYVSSKNNNLVTNTGLSGDVNINNGGTKPSSGNLQYIMCAPKQSNDKKLGNVTRVSPPPRMTINNHM